MFSSTPRSSSPPAQEQLADTGIHIGAIWKSARDKRACIQATIKTFNGSPPFLDLRIHELDSFGRMVPTSKGITCSMQRLPALAKLVGDCLRKAAALGLLTGASS
jgi:hypothetical protein